MGTSAWESGNRRADPNIPESLSLVRQEFPNDTNNGIGEPQSPTRITETVTLGSDCNHFSGTFTLDAYDTTGKTSSIVYRVVTATRVTTSTTVPDLL